jgi:hypothetical protein
MADSIVYAYDGKYQVWGGAFYIWGCALGYHSAAKRGKFLFSEVPMCVPFEFNNEKTV